MHITYTVDFCYVFYDLSSFPSEIIRTNNLCYIKSQTLHNSKTRYNWKIKLNIYVLCSFVMDEIAARHIKFYSYYKK